MGRSRKPLTLQGVRGFKSHPFRSWVSQQLTNSAEVLRERRTIDGRATGTNPLRPTAVAADALGDAHALDPETPLGALVVDAVVALPGAADPRSAWRSFGVELGSASASALCYTLPDGAGATVQAARSMAELRITGRMLDRGVGLDVRPGDVVSICENPSIVMIAADRLGAGGDAGSANGPDRFDGPGVRPHSWLPAYDLPRWRG